MNGVWCLWTAAVVATLVVSAGGQLTELTEAESCFEGAQQSAAAGPMPGGYSEIDDPSSDQRVMSAAQLAMTRLNGVSNNGYMFDTSTDDGLIAFSQVVAGTRYCIRFSASNVRCSSESAVCSDSLPQSLVCDADVVLLLYEDEPQDERLVLHCH